MATFLSYRRLTLQACAPLLVRVLDLVRAYLPGGEHRRLRIHSHCDSGRYHHHPWHSEAPMAPIRASLSLTRSLLMSRARLAIPMQTTSRLTWKASFVQTRRHSVDQACPVLKTAMVAVLLVQSTRTDQLGKTGGFSRSRGHDPRGICPRSGSKEFRILLRMVGRDSLPSRSFCMVLFVEVLQHLHDFLVLRSDRSLLDLSEARTLANSQRTAFVSGIILLAISVLCCLKINFVTSTTRSHRIH